MRSARIGLAALCVASLAVSACGKSTKIPQLMHVRSSTNGPDEFAILPPKPLEMPESLVDLPEPTLGGSNLTDPRPFDDAIVALGGRPQTATGVPSADSALYAHAGRKGVSADIRSVLASEDLAFRRKNDGRLLERLFDVNVYFKAYRKYALDQHAELERWRARGVRTPSAPPPKPDEE